MSPNLLIESKFAKIQISHFQEGGGLVETNFQLLMPSPNLLKSTVPIFRNGGGGGSGGAHGSQFPTFDAESKFAKIHSSHLGGGGGLMETNFQLLMPSPNLLKSKVPIFGRGGFVETNF